MPEARPMKSTERAERGTRRGATRMGGIMAKESAFATSSSQLPLGSRSATRGQLWQVPTFFAGVLALCAVWAARPLWRDFGPQGLDYDLVLLRRALEQPQVDLNEVLGRAEKALNKAAQYPRRAGETHYLTGAVYVRMTRQVAAEQRADLWQKARFHLEQAEEQGTPEADRSRLAFLLGKTWHHLGVDPQRVITCLKNSIDSAADDQGDAYGLLAEAYLRLPTPDLHAALAANAKQLACPTLDDAALAKPRLLRAELLFRLDEPDEARQTLKHLLERRGPGTPSRVLEQARFLLARSLQNEGAWGEALHLWEEVQTNETASANEKARAQYFLGLCHRKLGHPNEAGKAWERVQHSGGDEGQAATLALADLWVFQKMPVPALQAFTAFVHDLSSPGDYQNALVDLATARATFENACRSLREAGDYANAAQVVRLYERLAVPGKQDELIAQTTEAWGRQLLDQSRQAANSVEAKRLEDAAFEKFRQAAQAYESAAEMARTVEERNECLWRAADRYSRGQDLGRALLVLERFVKLTEVPSSRLGEAWFIMAETHRAQQHVVAAQVAYRRCIEYLGPFAYQARYQLAMAEMDQKNLDDAEAHLQQNLKLIQEADEGAVASEAYEKTLFSLAQLTVQRGEFRQAEHYLSLARDRFPANPKAQWVLFQLARCYRVRAKQEGQLFGVNERVIPEAQMRYRKEQMRLLEMAAVHYLKIVDDLTPQTTNGHLSREDESLLKQALFGVADCRYEEGQNDESIRLFQKLADSSPNQIDGLIALSYMCRGYWAKEQPKKVRQLWNQIQLTLKQMDPAAFDGTSETRTRGWWESWLANVDRQLRQCEQ